MEHLIKLREILEKQFSQNEIQALCDELDIDIGRLSAEAQSDPIIALLAFLQHQDSVDRLVELIKKYRPDIDLSFIDGPVDLTARHRPIGAGSSISNGRGGAATLGCLVSARHNPDDFYILCDGSGLFADGLEDGDPIIQPASSDGGSLLTDLIGTISDFVLPTADEASNLSAAIISVQNPKEVSPQLPDGNFLKEDVDAEEGWSISGFSRSTGAVDGEITSIDASVTVPWVFEDGSQQEVEFTGLIETTPMLAAGDSGMVIFDGDHRPVGLGFAGGADFSLFFPIGRILDYFEVEIITEEFWKHYRM